MQSEQHIQQALEALAAQGETFRSAVAVAVDQIDAYLATHRAPANGGAAERVRIELGPFAAGRVDNQRFSALFGTGEVLDPFALARVERALETLRAISERGDALFRTRVAPGGDLRTTIASALAEAGRAFGAARAVELTRQGRYPADEHDGYATGFGFRYWNRAERQIAPPLVVEVDGGDAQAGGLAEFLDGRQKIVLVVRGAAPPAALVRLITPGVFVMQTSDAADLQRLPAVGGPAIAAVLPEGAARFVHDPAGGEHLWERLTVQHVPDEEPRAALGAFTAFQQAEELRLLREMAAVRAPAAPAAEAEPAPLREQAAVETPVTTGSADPVDRLAAWLLSQADLNGTA